MLKTNEKIQKKNGENDHYEALIILENIPGICYSALRVWTVLVTPSVYMSVHCQSGCVTPVGPTL